MKNRKVVLGLAVGLSAFAPVSFAEEVTGKVGMEACAQALMESIQSSSEYKINPQGRGLENRLSRSEVIYLDAKIGDDNVVAKANCRVNGDAEVVALEILDNDAPEARRRAL